jgi:hypothetical protein
MVADNKLCVKQGIPAAPEPVDKVDKADLAGIALAAKHALAGKQGPDRYTI